LIDVQGGFAAIKKAGKMELTDVAPCAMTAKLLKLQQA